MNAPATTSAQRAVKYEIVVPALFSKAASMYLTRAKPLAVWSSPVGTPPQSVVFTIIVKIKDDNIGDCIALLISYLKQHTSQRIAWVSTPVSFTESPEV